MPLMFAKDKNAIFSIGKPDGCAGEFKFFRGLDDLFFQYSYGERKYRNLDKTYEFFKNPPTFVVGKSKDSDWSFIHPIYNCSWDGKNNAPTTFKIEFNKPKTKAKQLYLKIGIADTTPQNAIGLKITLNGKELAVKRDFYRSRKYQGTLAYHKGAKNTPAKPYVLPIKIEDFKDGKNVLELTGVAPEKIRSNSIFWLVYDFIELSKSKNYPNIPDYQATLLNRAIKAIGGEEVIFCVTGSTRGGHWYENIGRLCQDDTDHPQIQSRQGQESFSRMGGRLVRFNLRTGEYKILLEDDRGGMRDAHMHYDGKKVLFSYRKGDSSNYNLYEIDVDGKNLTKLPMDTGSNDVEPCYLPNDDIMYVSDRMNRTVQCWMSPTLNLHRFFRKEKVVVCMSGNPDVDNTPTVLRDGRVLYMRWDYNHRNQNVFHHLWSINPDGSNNTIFYGNVYPGGVFINARQLPDGEDIIFTLMPGHGRRNNQGSIAKLSPPFDPSDPFAFKFIEAPHRRYRYFEPIPLKDNLILTCDAQNIIIMDTNGIQITIPVPVALFNSTAPEQRTHHIAYEKIYPGGKTYMLMRSVVPIMKRPRESIKPDMADYSKKTAQVFLQDVYEGRNMKGVKRGSIKKLLITRVQPATVNYHGGYGPTGFQGTFALEEVVGTVPVYEDGSAFFEVPAMVGIAFSALEENGTCVKRMMSSTNFAPGTQTSCIGCHEQRTAAPIRKQKLPMAYRKGVSKIEPLKNAKNIIDYTRDIQPLINKYCLECHNPKKPTAGVILSFGVGFEHITPRLVLQICDMCNSDYNRWGNRPPYSFGSGASKLARFSEGKHHNKKFSDEDMAILKAWLDCGSPHISSYAAKGAGFPMLNRMRTRLNIVGHIPEIAKAQSNACSKCHFNKHTRGGAGRSFEYDFCTVMRVKTPKGKLRTLKFPVQGLYDYSNPENSVALIVPLAKSAGGSAENNGKAHPVVFKDKNDPNYKLMLAGVQKAAKILDEKNPSIVSKNFRPSFGYIQQMKKCKILPENWNPKKPLNLYQIDNSYFRWQEKNVYKKVR